jgi:hypothetical protein
VSLSPTNLAREEIWWLATCTFQKIPLLPTHQHRPHGVRAKHRCLHPHASALLVALLGPWTTPPCHDSPPITCPSRIGSLLHGVRSPGPACEPPVLCGVEVLHSGRVHDGGVGVKLRRRWMVLKTVAATTARCYELIVYAGGGPRWANYANRIHGGVRAPSSMFLQSLQFTAVAECKRSAGESSGSSLRRREGIDAPPNHLHEVK